MHQKDLVTTLDWARQEGWNPGRDDARLFLSADPEGFLIADHEGAPAASISLVGVGPGHAFLGLFICRADLRGRGLAGPLWDAAMAQAQGRSVGLDGVVAQQGRYAAQGFRATHRTLRFAGIAPARSGGDEGRSEAIVAADLPAIRALDRQATGFDRPGFLSVWMQPRDGHVVHLIRDGTEAAAVGVLRACDVGWKIGPLLARSAEAARAVLHDLVALAQGDRIMIDVPDDQPDAAALARSLGLAPVFETARMWNGPPPPRGTGMEYGVATLELG
ncbi:GNAT family N-acetyltransferase [Mesobaculum littorinae]|uniref:GNAT family N-acetyltransferase n=1 Tax=Mesobaculum littorinae TaxID=2486419 RepID=A0A438AG65_9RHOB|nr:GNAT family N-acetyltransferase [Mesobaculum littorinae]RVV97688.1 GNAT family N-acetyltransferase [Mesobaculum littorinae]